MIKTRLVALLSHAKKYIVQNIFWQWVALLAQMTAVFSVAGLLQSAYSGTLDGGALGRSALVLAVSVCIRFVCDRLASRASYAASVDVKRILREKIYEKLLRLGASYREKISTSEIVQMSSEGVEQLEIYFGKYLPQQFRSITMKVLTMQLNSTSVMDIMAYGGAAVGMIVAISEFAKGRLDLAGTLTILLLASEIFIPLRLLGSFFHIAMNGMAASDKIFALLDLPEPTQGSAVVPDRAEDITLSGVYFSYEQDREILKGIDLTLKAGSFVSLVGTSGCGKSTISGLLSGKIKDTPEASGSVTMSQVPETDLMQYITVVTHNSYLFKGTVEENLRMARPDATEKEMQEVLEKVNLWAFLQTQQGLQTTLLEQAGNLSGGQRQRLALARALLHDTPVYIFDEATSNIDMESEELIMEVIRDLAKTRTVLLISHRLANVVDSDVICMLDGGRIREMGTHEELMNRQGSYYALYESQRRLEEYTKEVTA